MLKLPPRILEANMNLIATVPPENKNHVTDTTTRLDQELTLPVTGSPS